VNLNVVNPLAHGRKKFRPAFFVGGSTALEQQDLSGFRMIPANETPPLMVRKSMAKCEK